MPPRDKNISQPPRGTRDFYPIELARRRWIEDKWRRAAIRHGFDEIDGPTFEHLDLYTVKSGEGIVNELFSFKRAGGETDFALRPEFTPTLARMVAAKANALPKPIKWFSIGPYFRAERPQRGRLREFLQWNVDVLGNDFTVETMIVDDTDAIMCCVELLKSVGLKPNDVNLTINYRPMVVEALNYYGVGESDIAACLALIDKRAKLSADQFDKEANGLGLNVESFDAAMRSIERSINDRSNFSRPLVGFKSPSSETYVMMDPVLEIMKQFDRLDMSEWVRFNPNIVRGLAYYTHTVFEVHETGGKERAIAGGGRYNNLVELFGGPPTPAVGFAMGDVVLSLVLQDKGLMPSDDDIARDLNLNPDVFVLTTGDEPSEHALTPALALLRARGLHARRSYKSTRNLGKLLQDASKANARFALILESATSATLKDMGKQGAGEEAQRALRADSLGALIDQAASFIPPR